MLVLRVTFYSLGVVSVPDPTNLSTDRFSIVHFTPYQIAFSILKQVVLLRPFALQCLLGEKVNL